MNIVFLAVAYLRFNWLRSTILVLVAALILSVPLISQILLNSVRTSLTDRAETTPLLLGNRGSQLDLVMNAVYFSENHTLPVTMDAVQQIWETAIATPIPLNTMFTTNGAPIIGTTLDYFDFRQLKINDGRQLAFLGEAVLGAAVADRFGLGPDGTLISTPENLFDLDGVYPLELNIVGVLAPTGTPDDDAVFVDIATTWVIAGIGHGHENAVATDAGTNEIIVNADTVEFNRITPETIDSFHFHGDPSSYPVSAVLVVPDDDRARTILRGRYLGAENILQIVVPHEVVRELVDRIFRVKSLLDAVVLIIGSAAFAAIGLALFLSYRLRQRELQMAFKIGARRGMMLRLVGTEVAILLMASGLIASSLVILLQTRGGKIIAWLLAT